MQFDLPQSTNESFSASAFPVNVPRESIADAQDRNSPQSFLDILATAASEEDAIQITTQFLSNTNSIAASWFVEPKTSGELTTISTLKNESNIEWYSNSSLAEACRESLTTNTTAIVSSRNSTFRNAIAVPCGDKKHRRVLCISNKTDENALAITIAIAEQVAAAWMLRSATKQVTQNQRFANFSSNVLKLVEEVAAKPTSHGSCLMLVNRLTEILGAKKVILVKRRSEEAPFRVEAVSGTDSFDSNSPLVDRIQQLSELSVDWTQPLLWREKVRGDYSSATDHDVQQIATEISASCVIGIPLRANESNEGSQCGCLIIAGDESLATRDESWYAMRILGQLIGSLLGLISRTEVGFSQELRRRTQRFCKSKKSMIVGTIFILAAIAMFIPVPHKIATDCEIQPVSRRFVSAPFDAKLREAIAKPGDMVHAGDLLARLDDNEVRMELSSLRAELQRESKRFDSALATRNVAESQIAKHEMEKLKLDIELKETRLKGLEIVAPVSGVVVSGDLKKSEGAPLSIGQTMFEIAPLEKMVVELLVPEEDVSFVKPEMAVKIRTDALPFQPIVGAVQRIHPRSEIRNDASVFIAELEIDNEDNVLRPGMNGGAKIVAGKRPLGWILFHRAWEKAMFVIGN